MTKFQFNLFSPLGAAFKKPEGGHVPPPSPIRVNKLQKEYRTKIDQESTISWEKFCNSITLESDPKKSWRKITNFLKSEGPRSYPTLKLGNKTAKTKMIYSSHVLPSP